DSLTESFHFLSRYLGRRTIGKILPTRRARNYSFASVSAAAAFGFLAVLPLAAIEGALPSVRISVTQVTVISPREPRLRREFLRRRFLNAITFGPRLWSSTSAATEAPLTRGTPSTGASPPTTSTSPSCTIVPTSPAILPISSTSSGTTRYCLPPVLM